MDYFNFSFSVFKVLFSVAKGWTETKKYGKISIRACLKNDALKSGVDGEWRIFVMIRNMQNIDINRVADIWLKTNLKAHYFIPEQYWTSNYELVKEMLLQAEVYVYEDGKMIQGFVGLSNEYIEGIFVSDEMQSCGIGKLLLDYIKNKKVRLRLNVYQKNTRALSFYQREGFDIQCEGFDGTTGEKEYTMLWQKK